MLSPSTDLRTFLVMSTTNSLLAAFLFSRFWMDDLTAFFLLRLYSASSSDETNLFCLLSGAGAPPPPPGSPPAFPLVTCTAPPSAPPFMAIHCDRYGSPSCFSSGSFPHTCPSAIRHPSSFPTTSDRATVDDTKTRSLTWFLPSRRMTRKRNCPLASMFLYVGGGFFLSCMFVCVGRVRIGG